MKFLLHKLQSLWKKVRHNQHFYYLLIICIVGLIPILWYRPGFMALGHDMGFPISPDSWFSDRLTTWTERNNYGQDQSILMGSIILHGFEYIMYMITGHVSVAQAITYVFWFMLLGISMYLFLVTLLSDKHKKAALIGSILYMCNLFFLQAWFIAERNKFAVMAALPLALLFSIKVIRDKYPVWKAAFAIAFTYLLFNGGGSVPLFGSTLLIFPAAILILIFTYNKNIRTFIRSVVFLIVTGIVTALVNIFWILPQMFTLKYAFSIGVESAGGVSGNKSWIDEISKFASYANLFRMQGFPDWSTEHHYAGLYLTNIIFIVASFIFIALAIYAIWKARKQQERVAVAIGMAALLLTTIFAAGSSGLFGETYVWLVDHVSLFVIFRTPFYKFASGIVFAYCIMFSLGLSYFAQDLKNILTKRLPSFSQFEKLIKPLSIAGAIVLLIVYVYPIITGSFFAWNKPITTMVQVPSYVFDYRDYLKTDLKTKGKILMVPDISESNGLDITDWNFFSLDNIPSLATNKAHVMGGTATSYVANSDTTVKILYKNLLAGTNPGLVQYILDSYDIDHVLLRKDLISFRNATITEPAKWEEALNQTTFLRKEKTFGEWTLYSVDTLATQASLTHNAQVIYGNPENISELYYANFINPKQDQVFVETAKSLNKDAEQKLADVNHRTVLELNPTQGKVEDGKIVYNLTTQPGEYEIVAKQFDISELWYRLYVHREGAKIVFSIERPETKVNVNGKELIINSRRQNFEVIPQGGIDKLIINGETFNMPTNITATEQYIDTFQTGSSQVSLSYANNGSYQRTRNVISDGSFEVGPWTGAQICGGPLLPRNVSASRITIAVDGKSSASLSSQGGTIGCLIQPLKTLDRTKMYELSFQYKNVSGLPLRYCILRRDTLGSKITDKGCMKEGILPKAEGWQTQVVDFAPSDSSEHILHFYADSEQDVTTTNYIDNVFVSSLDALPIGTFTLNTGIELSQFFNVQQNYENKGIIQLQDQNVVQTVTQGGFENKQFINDENFEKTLWGGVNLCGGDSKKSKISVTQDSDKVTGKFSARLTAKDGTACIYNPIQNFRPSLIYKVSFDYKHISGRNGEFCALVQDKNGSTCSPQLKLDDSKEWKTFSTLVSTTKDTEQVILHFYSPAKTDESSVNLYDNVRVEAVYNPIQNLYFVSKYTGETKQEGTFTLTKESAVSYNVTVTDIKDPELFTLKTSYSPFWIMLPTKASWTLLDQFKAGFMLIFNGTMPNALPHVHTGALFNGWVVIEPGTYKIIYLPNSVFLLGLAISILFVVLSIIVILLRKRVASIIKRITKIIRIPKLHVKLPKVALPKIKPLSFGAKLKKDKKENEKNN